MVLMVCSEEPTESEHTLLSAFLVLVVVMAHFLLKRGIRTGTFGQAVIRPRMLGQAVEASEEADFSDPWDAFALAEEADAGENLWAGSRSEWS